VSYIPLAIDTLMKKRVTLTIFQLFLVQVRELLKEVNCWIAIRIRIRMNEQAAWKQAAWKQADKRATWKQAHKRAAWKQARLTTQ